MASAAPSSTSGKAETKTVNTSGRRWSVWKQGVRYGLYAVGAIAGYYAYRYVRSSRREAYIKDMMKKGHAAHRAGKHKEAAKLFTGILDYQDNRTAYFNRALCYMRMEQWALAEDDLSEALRLEPTYNKAYFVRGRARHRLGKLAESLSDYARVEGDWQSKAELHVREIAGILRDQTAAPTRRRKKRTTSNRHKQAQDFDIDSGASPVLGRLATAPDSLSKTRSSTSNGAFAAPPATHVRETAPSLAKTKSSDSIPIDDSRELAPSSLRTSQVLANGHAEQLHDKAVSNGTVNGVYVNDDVNGGDVHKTNLSEVQNGHITSPKHTVEPDGKSQHKESGKMAPVETPPETVAEVA